MEDDLGAADRVVHALVATQLPLDDLDVEPGEVLAAAGREVVEHAHVVAALEQAPDEVGADEAAAAGDEDTHHRPTSVRMCTSSCCRECGLCPSSRTTSCKMSAEGIRGETGTFPPRASLRAMLIWRPRYES